MSTKYNPNIHVVINSQKERTKLKISAQSFFPKSHQKKKANNGTFFDYYASNNPSQCFDSSNNKKDFDNDLYLNINAKKHTPFNEKLKNSENQIHNKDISEENLNIKTYDISFLGSNTSNTSRNSSSTNIFATINSVNRKVSKKVKDEGLNKEQMKKRLNKKLLIYIYRILCI